MITSEIDKRAFDQFGHAVRFHRVLGEAEQLSSVSLTATLLSDGSDVSLAFLVSATAVIPSGTATGGSTTTIINTALNHSVDGFRVGDFVMNTTKGDIINVPPGIGHKIKVMGDKPAVRLAITIPDVAHVFEDDNG